MSYFFSKKKKRKKERKRTKHNAKKRFYMQPNRGPNKQKRLCSWEKKRHTQMTRVKNKKRECKHKQLWR
jgi:hypothetical protein